MQGGSTRPIRNAILGVEIALVLCWLVGCTLKESPEQPPSAQSTSNTSPLPVEGSCKSPDAPSADVAHRAGYRQFDVSVTNSIGWPVAGLAQQDFVLYAGLQTVPVAYFREHNKDDPVAVAVVVESSGSMGSKWPSVKESLGNFLMNLSPCEEVGLFAFNSQVYLLQPFSSDHRTAAEKIGLINPDGKSALYDATNAALQRLEGTHYSSRKLILITDGLDNSSTVTEQAVAARAATDDIPIYAIGIGDPNAPAERGIAVGPVHLTHGSSEPLGEPVEITRPSDVGTYQVFTRGVRIPPGTQRVNAKELEDLSTTAGGRSYIVPILGEVGRESFETAIFAISDNIARGYTIGAVVPDGVDPTTVKVSVTKPRGLDVQARPISAAH